MLTTIDPVDCTPRKSMRPQTHRPCSSASRTFAPCVIGVSSMSEDVASNRSNQNRHKKTHRPNYTRAEPRASTRMNLGRRIGSGGSAKACAGVWVAMAVFVMVVRWCSSVPSVHKISESVHQSFSPTAVGESRQNLAKSPRSHVMRWNDAAIVMIDLLRLSSKRVELCR